MSGTPGSIDKKTFKEVTLTPKLPNPNPIPIPTPTPNPNPSPNPNPNPNPNPSPSPNPTQVRPSVTVMPKSKTFGGTLLASMGAKRK